MDAFAEFYRKLSPAEKKTLADNSDTSVAYLKQIANGHRKCGPKLLGRLIRADPRITPGMLRPDLVDLAGGAAA